MNAKTLFRSAAAACFTALVLIALAPVHAAAMCCPMPCFDCFLTSRGQLNLVLMDREAGRVRMIPNIRFAGTAPDFALIVPTPTEPDLTPADRRIWNEAEEMTAPVRTNRFGNDNGLGCGDSIVGRSETTAGGAPDDVSVIRTVSVGAFLATLVRSDNPEALVEWLNGNGFNVDAAEAAAIAPFAERGWVFTAMKLDTSKPEARVPQGGWDSNVDPVVFDFPAADLEVPLSIIGINRGPDMPVVFYVVDDHRTELPGFETLYANRLSTSEYEASKSRYPNLARYLESGRYLTRLDRTFPLSDPMNGSIKLARAASDDEFRRYGTNTGSLSVELLLLLASPFAARWIGRRRAN